MTPYEIRLALHYYYSAEDHNDITRDPPVTRPTIAQFLSDGLLVYLSESERDQYGATYRITDRGRAYCEALQRVRLPIQVWIQPEDVTP